MNIHYPNTMAMEKHLNRPHPSRVNSHAFSSKHPSFRGFNNSVESNAEYYVPPQSSVGAVEINIINPTVKNGGSKCYTDGIQSYVPQPSPLLQSSDKYQDNGILEQLKTLQLEKGRYQNQINDLLEKERQYLKQVNDLLGEKQQYLQQINTWHAASTPGQNQQLSNTAPVNQTITLPSYLPPQSLSQGQNYPQQTGLEQYPSYPPLQQLGAVPQSPQPQNMSADALSDLFKKAASNQQNTNEINQQNAAKQTVAPPDVKKKNGKITSNNSVADEDYSISKERLNELEKLLNDIDPMVRSEAALDTMQEFKVHKIRSKHPGLINLLNKILKDDDQNVRLMGLIAIDAGYANGDVNTKKILKRMTESERVFGEDSIKAKDLLKTLSERLEDETKQAAQEAKNNNG